MYKSLLEENRTRRAILDEYLPEWRTLVWSGPKFKSAWTAKTGSGKTSAFRWHAYALAVQAEEIAGDAIAA